MDIVKECHRNRLGASCLPVDAGSTIYNNTEEAEKASRWLWLKREVPWKTAARAPAETWKALTIGNP